MAVTVPVLRYLKPPEYYTSVTRPTPPPPKPCAGPSIGRGMTAGTGASQTFTALFPIRFFFSDNTADNLGGV